MTIDAGDRQTQANPIAIRPIPNSRIAARAGNSFASPTAASPVSKAESIR